MNKENIILPLAKRGNVFARSVTETFNTAPSMFLRYAPIIETAVTLALQPMLQVPFPTVAPTPVLSISADNLKSVVTEKPLEA